MLCAPHLLHGVHHPLQLQVVKLMLGSFMFAALCLCVIQISCHVQDFNIAWWVEVAPWVEELDLGEDKKVFAEAMEEEATSFDIAATCHTHSHLFAATCHTHTHFILQSDAFEVFRQGVACLWDA